MAFGKNDLDFPALAALQNQFHHGRVAAGRVLVQTRVGADETRAIASLISGRSQRPGANCASEISPSERAAAAR